MRYAFPGEPITKDDSCRATGVATGVTASHSCPEARAAARASIRAERDTENMVVRKRFRRRGKVEGRRERTVKKHSQMNTLKEGERRVRNGEAKGDGVCSLNMSSTVLSTVLYFLADSGSELFMSIPQCAAKQ